MSRPPRRSVRLLPFLAAGLVAAAVFWLFLELEERDRAQQRQQVTSEATEAERMVRGTIERRARELGRLAGAMRKRLALDPHDYPTQSQWEREASLVGADEREVSAIEFVNAAGKVLWIVPIHGNERALNQCMADHPGHLEAIKRARRSRGPTITGQVELLQGGPGFVLFVPVALGERVVGFMCAVFRTQRFMAEVARRLAAGTLFRLHVGSDTVFGPEDATWNAGGDIQATRRFPVCDSRWSVVIRSMNDTQRAEAAPLNELILIVGLLAAGLVGLVAAMAVRDRERRMSEARTNQRLRTLVTDLEASQTRLRGLAARLHKVREQERLTIARELHDEWGQRLTAMRLDLAWLAGHTDDEGMPRLAEMMRLVGRTLEDAREAARRLRPTILDDIGLVAALKDLVTGFAIRTDIAVQMRITDDVPPDQERDVAIFRIAQEALTNVARHAGAHHVEVELARRTGAIVLTVTDDGCGIDSAASEDNQALGVVGMRERATALGGQITIGPALAGRGTRVHLLVPIELEKEQA